MTDAAAPANASFGVRDARSASVAIAAVTRQLARRDLFARADDVAGTIDDTRLVLVVRIEHVGPGDDERNVMHQRATHAVFLRSRLGAGPRADGQCDVDRHATAAGTRTGRAMPRHGNAGSPGS